MYFTHEPDKKAPYANMQMYRQHPGSPKSMRGVIFGDTEEQAIANLVELTEAKGCLMFSHEYRRKRYRSYDTDYGNFAAVWYSTDMTADFDFFFNFFLEKRPKTISWMLEKKRYQDVYNALRDHIKARYGDRYAIVGNGSDRDHLLADLETGMAREISISKFRVTLSKHLAPRCPVYVEGDEYGVDSSLCRSKEYTRYHKLAPRVWSIVPWCGADPELPLEEISVATTVSEGFESWWRNPRRYDHFLSEGAAVFPMLKAAENHAKAKFGKLAEAGLLSHCHCSFTEDSSRLRDIVEMYVPTIKAVLKLRKPKGKIPVSRLAFYKMLQDSGTVENMDYLRGIHDGDPKAKAHPMYPYVMENRKYLEKLVKSNAGRDPNSYYYEDMREIIQDYDRVKALVETKLEHIRNRIKDNLRLKSGASDLDSGEQAGDGVGEACEAGGHPAGCSEETEG